MLGLTAVRIAGPSMEPALKSGDWWLVRTVGRIRPGDVLLLRHPARPDLLVVKRAVREDPAGWWVEGDNAAWSDDSRGFGSVPRDRVIGCLLLRYRRGPT
ncbi:MAG: nickel-type superoxide dismutase maturation protease [Candidatus Nanopelagicales bacterium]|jgi:nickel-type superoxide dismutase maturation protease